LFSYETYATFVICNLHISVDKKIHRHFFRLIFIFKKIIQTFFLHEGTNFIRRFI